ncbi:metalloprotease PmbA [Sedimenticola thiotaurini]|uniref:Peptidase PmbA n=1 Tax=Sedimenticola thiotaurini TaxID=1543721 RepID=A0A0F7JWN2_9GAMM|nr:metalloprotease PmbA [Sedimenticola thiotaurini]AKH20931.1 peptidase PmbA [Sedimenticola thiotaurini]
MSEQYPIAARQAQLEQMVDDLLKEAHKQGASAAEAAVSSDSGLSISVRKGEVETIEHTRDQGLGVTVYFGQRKGTASTSDFKPEAIRDTVRAACNIARFTNEDPYSGLADADLMARDLPELDLYHPWDITPEAAIELGVRCERAALELDPRISNTEGASVNSHNGLHVYGNSHGFIGGYPSSRHSLSCSVIGQQDDSMQRDYWYTVSRRAEDLESELEVGRKAAERTLARLGARKIGTRQAPVIFRADVAGSLLRSLISAISGSSLYRKASFLLDHLGKPIFPAHIQIQESPRIPRGLGSAAFDSEGVATYDKQIIADGILQTYLLSSYSARKLGMQTTANAGGVHNLSITPGEQDLEEMLQEMGTGLLVTEMMGQGVNMVTGDYSRGAAGFWVEQGEIQYPVEEITIAGNLKQMFAQLRAVGSDEERRSSIRTGSLLIEQMTIAGE